MAHDPELLQTAQKNECGLKKSTEAQGLEIHPDRTDTLTNHKSNKLKEIEIDGMHVEILLPQGKVEYLGQMVTFMHQETTEVQYRIRCAWSAFVKTSLTFYDTGCTSLTLLSHRQYDVRCRNMDHNKRTRKHAPAQPSADCFVSSF